MLGAIVAQDWDEAAAQTVDSDWCGQVGKGYHSNGDPKRCTDTELGKAGCPAADSFSNRPEGAAATEFDERGSLAADVVNDPAGAVAELGESLYDAYSATTEDVANLLSSGGQSVIEVMGLAADSFTGAFSWFHDMWGVTTADPERRRLDEAEWCIPSGRRLSSRVPRCRRSRARRCSCT